MNKHEVADLKLIEKQNNWDEMADVERCLERIKIDLKDFQDKFDSNFYHSEEDAMVKQFDLLNDMLAELVDEVNQTHKNVPDYYK